MNSEIGKYSTYVTEITIARGDDNPVFGETVTKLRLQDACAGLFLEVIQEGNDFNGDTKQCIRLDFEELKNIADAAKILEDNAKKYSEIETKLSFGYAE